MRKGRNIGWIGNIVSNGEEMVEERKMKILKLVEKISMLKILRKEFWKGEGGLNEKWWELRKEGWSGMGGIEEKK